MPIIPTTWNPSDKAAGLTLTNGNKTVGTDADALWKGVRAIVELSAGKPYWEITLAMNYDWPFFAGVATLAAVLTAYLEADNECWLAGTDELAHGGYVGAGPNGTNGVLRFAFDKPSGKLWIAKDAGAWYGGGDPEAGTLPTFSGIAGSVYPIFSLWCYGGTGRTATVNFGASAFSYSVPAGFQSGHGVNTDVTVTCPEMATVAALSASVPLVPPVDLSVVAALSAQVVADYSLAAAALAAITGLSVSNILQFIEGASRITYECILTGDADGISDLTLPISSFQGRLKSGDPSYLSVIVPGTDYDAAISARSNGDLIVRMVKTLASGNVIREEICRVDLEDIRLYEGDTSQSCELSGHRTVTNAAKELTLTGASYRAVTNGLLRYRCSPHLYLRAGDTVNIEDDTFVADSITISISADQETMEVAQAGA